MMPVDAAHDEEVSMEIAERAALQFHRDRAERIGKRRNKSVAGV